MTFEDWYNENYGDIYGDMRLLDHEADMRAELEDEYRVEMVKEAEQEARFGADWLERQRRELRARVNEILRIMERNDFELDVKHAWMYSQVGEVEYAQYLGIITMRKAISMKREMFDAYDQARARG